MIVPKREKDISEIENKIIGVIHSKNEHKGYCTRDKRTIWM